MLWKLLYNISEKLELNRTVRQIRDEAYDVLLTDLRLPDLGEQEEFFGDLKLPQFAKQTDPSIEAIIITGYASIYTIKQAMRAGTYDFILNLRNRWMLYKLLRMQSANAH